MMYTMCIYIFATLRVFCTLVVMNTYVVRMVILLIHFLYIFVYTHTAIVHLLYTLTQPLYI